MCRMEAESSHLVTGVVDGHCDTLTPTFPDPLAIGAVDGDGTHAAKASSCLESPNSEDHSSLIDGEEEVTLIHKPSVVITHDGSSPFHEVLKEMGALSRISAPLIATGILFYARNLISMLFLGRLGPVELAAGALSIGFANITGNSVIFGLAMGMEPICGQAYGAQRWSLLSLTLHRTVVILLLISMPISLLWLNSDRVLVKIGQDPSITKLAKTYLLFSLPDLIMLSILHPLRIYLRTQNIIQPIAVCTALATAIHIPLNYFLVITLRTGIKGVAAAMVLADFNGILFLVCYIYLTGACRKTWTGVSWDCIREWKPLLSLAIPSCISICLEWWWYEVMIILCGLLTKPEETISAIGILIQMTALVYVLPSSLSYGASTRVAHELGAGRPETARVAAMVGTACGGLAGVAAMGFDVWARTWWGAMFTDSTGVLKLVSAALPIVGMCELGNCPQTVMCGVLRGSARATVGAHVNLSGFYGVGLPVALALAFWMGLGFHGLWFGLLAAQVTCAVVLGWVLMRTNWSLQARRAVDLTRDGGDVAADNVGDEENYV